MNDIKQRQLLKVGIYSLSLLWIFTGLTSLFFARDIGYQTLANVGIDGFLASFLIGAGGLVDILLGLWLLSRKQLRLCCITQVLIIVTYTLLLSMIAPSYWLHPFGPVTKNIPILVLIGLVYLDAERV